MHDEGGGSPVDYEARELEFKVTRDQLLQVLTAISVARDESRRRMATGRSELDAVRAMLREARTRCSQRPDTLLQRSAVRRPESGGRPAEPTAGVDVLLTEYAATRDERLRKRIMAAYDAFALGIARAFPSRREAPEDLAQVARIGLLHAVDRFDPSLGRPFTTFARATIVGELKRHVRDRTWAMRVPRSLQEHYLVVVRTADDLTAELGRSPRVPEVADRCGLSEEQVLEAMELGSTQRPLSLDAPRPEGEGPGLDPGEDDPALGNVEGRELLGRLLERLPEREQVVLRMRFGEEMTQAQIAERIGVSQMYVSRLLARTLARMRVWAERH